MNEKLLESHWKHHGKKISLRLDTYETNGHRHTVEFVHHPGAVGILAIDRQNMIYLVRQWRRTIGKTTLEIPAGTLEKDEEPISCAKRELQEEIGYKANKLTSLGGFYSAPGFCDHYLHLFLGEDLEPSKLSCDIDEEIECVILPLHEAINKIKSGEIIDAKTIAAILRFRLLMGE